MTNGLGSRRLLSVTVFLALMIGASACGGGGESTASDQASGSGSGGEGATTAMVVDTSFVLAGIDPAKLNEPTGATILHVLYDRLLTFEGDDVTEAVPSLAESYEVSDDASTYTFTLRDGLTFSDGNELTSDDVLWSLQRVQNIQSNSSVFLEGITITAPDDRTVVLEADRSIPELPFILASPALGILNREVVEAEGGSAGEDAATDDTAEQFLNTASAGSGPYMLESFDNTSQVVLAVNPEYWGDAPAVDRIVLRNVETERQRLNVERGEAQLALDLAGDFLDELPDELAIASSPAPDVWFVYMNADPSVSEATASPQFQEAVRYGLDYDGLLEIAGTGAVRAPGLVGSVFAGALDEGAAVERDVERAKQAAASVPDAGQIEFVYPSDVTFNGLNFGPVAERIQSSLQEVGLTITLTPQPIATFLESYRGGESMMGLTPYNPQYPDPSNYLEFSPGELYGLRAGWAVGVAPAVTQAAEEASATIDADERLGTYQRFQQVMNEESPFVPMFQPNAALVGVDGVAGLAYNPVWRVDLADVAVG